MSKAPAIVAPIVSAQTRDEIIGAHAQTTVYDPRNEENMVRPSFNRMKEIIQAFGVTSEYDPSYEPIVERPTVMLGEILNPVGYTNPIGIDSTPIAPEVKINLTNNLPIASAYTNTSGVGGWIDVEKSFDRLPQKPSPGEYTGRPLIPQTAGKRTLPILKR
jgi:hypothetical protein